MKADSGRAADKVHLADIQPVVAQDCVGGGQVKIEVRLDELEQIIAAAELQLHARKIQRDGFVFAAINLRRGEAGKKIHGLLQARLEFNSVSG